MKLRHQIKKSWFLELSVNGRKGKFKMKTILKEKCEIRNFTKRYQSLSYGISFTSKITQNMFYFSAPRDQDMTLFIVINFWKKWNMLLCNTLLKESTMAPEHLCTLSLGIPKMQGPNHFLFWPFLQVLFVETPLKDVVISPSKQRASLLLLSIKVLMLLILLLSYNTTHCMYKHTW